MAVDITTGAFHESAWKYVSFNEANASAGVQTLVSKEVVNDATRSYSRFIVERVMLSCTTGHIRVFDGSGRDSACFAVMADASGAGLAQTWDFRGDPVDLTNMDGTDLCISASGNISGFIKYAWGA